MKYTLHEPTNIDEVNQIDSRNDPDSTILEDWDFSHSCALVRDDGVVLAAGGVVPMFNKTGETWSVFTDEMADSHAILLTKLSKRMIDKWFESGDFERITALTLSKKLHVKWLMLLGFQPEGVLKNFGPGAVDDWCILGRTQ